MARGAVVVILTSQNLSYVILRRDLHSETPDGIIGAAKAPSLQNGESQRHRLPRRAHHRLQVVRGRGQRHRTLRRDDLHPRQQRRLYFRRDVILGAV